MHRFFIFVSLFLFATACSEDASTPDTGMTPADSGTPPDATPADATPDVSPDAPSDAAGGDTWATFAMGFFATYCVECHFGDPRDYRTIDHVRREPDATRIRCGVSDVLASGCGPSPAPQQFPVGTGPQPTVEERQRLVAWIEAGLPE